MIIGLVVLLLGIGALPAAAAADWSARAPAKGGEDGGEATSGSAPWDDRVRTFHGRAFDACTTPSRDTMRRWQTSDYRAVGVYYAGRGRACPHQPALTRSWARAVTRMGWAVLPVYVGSQSPCVGAGHKKGVRIGRHPWGQGKREARDAVRRAGTLGIERHSPLYLDMEDYDYRNRKCADTTLAYVRAWTKEVQRRGYVSGFYSSADSGVRHMEAARRAGVRDLPSVIWFARWHTKPHLYRERALGGNAWHPQRRIHQYAGNVKERHGGRTLVIDRNLVHAPVARIG
ncbi:DUF1906 domain-containing protein [Streptomyces sp. SID14478]|uniref:glycoside hydrolase domain-containing protein n=1 Tax=Streptomyces sp. SID14478 TaxID=2706073 RepID=UPI0013D95753|nr:glycoside hydrolase domain-containing protein [Streptomyces sp. SID14478]NEB76885.1 DUF1906 domain-containing protein [Streptomyces sp. SID14478]